MDIKEMKFGYKITAFWSLVMEIVWRFTDEVYM